MTSDQPRDSEFLSELPIPAQEQLLTELLDEVPGERVLCSSLGRAQLGRFVAQSRPSARVTCWFLDLYRKCQAEQYIAEQDRESCPAEGSTPVELVCAADFPEQPYDAIFLPFSVSGEAELTRDLMQAAYLRLVDGGTLTVSVDNPRDRWLQGEMEKLFPRIIRFVKPQGVSYQGIRRGPLKKQKDFWCEFACRDGERLLRVFSRPGVFAHRRVDPGARHLLNFMELNVGDRVLDLGCGSGVVTLGAAASSPQVHVHAVDTNARSIECTLRGAEANQLANVTAELSSADDFRSEKPFQLVLANPPYFSGNRISRAFLDAAGRCLEPGGHILLVTKLPQWYAEHMCEWFENIRYEEVKQYHLFWGTQPR